MVYFFFREVAVEYINCGKVSIFQNYQAFSFHLKSLKFEIIFEPFESISMTKKQPFLCNCTFSFSVNEFLCKIKSSIKNIRPHLCILMLSNKKKICMRQCEFPKNSLHLNALKSDSEYFCMPLIFLLQHLLPGRLSVPLAP